MSTPVAVPAPRPQASAPSALPRAADVASRLSPEARSTTPAPARERAPQFTVLAPDAASDAAPVHENSPADAPAVSEISLPAEAIETTRSAKEPTAAELILTTAPGAVRPLPRVGPAAARSTLASPTAGPRALSGPAPAPAAVDATPVSTREPVSETPQEPPLEASPQRAVADAKPLPAATPAPQRESAATPAGESEIAFAVRLRETRPQPRAEARAADEPAPAPAPRAERSVEAGPALASPARASSAPAPEIPSAPVATHVVAEPGMEETVAPRTVRQISLKVGSEGEAAAHVRLSQRGGEVVVSVRGSDSAVAETLRGHLPELTAKLESRNVTAEVWRPTASSSSETRDSEPARDPGGRGAAHEQHASEQRSAEHDRRERQARPEWLDEDSELAMQMRRRS
jgi:hypothetical protein